MSGGSMNYVYMKLEQDAVFETHTPEREAFAKHLQLVIKALHDIEWVDSCDYGEGDENEAIRAVLLSAQAQQVQKPFGYVCDDFKDGGTTLYEVPQESCFGKTYRNQPLYAQPVQAIPAGFIDFARDVLSDFPHYMPDGFDLQDLAIKHGLLVGNQVTKPCSDCDNCNCANYHGEEGMKDGVTCYRRCAAIAAAPQPAQEKTE